MESIYIRMNCNKYVTHLVSQTQVWEVLTLEQHAAFSGQSQNPLLTEFWREIQKEPIKDQDKVSRGLTWDLVVNSGPCTNRGFDFSESFDFFFIEKNVYKWRQRFITRACKSIYIKTKLMPILNNDKVKIINDSIKASPGPTSVLQCVNHGHKYDKQWALMVWERMAHTARPPAEWMSEVHAQRIEINVGTAALYSYDLYLCRKVTGNWFSLVITHREEQRRESNWINTAQIVKHDTGILINIQTHRCSNKISVLTPREACFWRQLTT